MLHLKHAAELNAQQEPHVKLAGEMEIQLDGAMFSQRQSCMLQILQHSRLSLICPNHTSSAPSTFFFFFFFFFFFWLCFIGEIMTTQNADVEAPRSF
jgi:hypothetical protein